MPLVLVSFKQLIQDDAGASVGSYTHCWSSGIANDVMHFVSAQEHVASGIAAL